MNNLDELTNASRTGSCTIAGSFSGSPACVAVAGTGITTGTANLYGDGSWARSGATLANGSNFYTPVATDSYSRTSIDTVSLNLPATNTLTYDANGNLTNVGQRYFSYDDEIPTIS